MNSNDRRDDADYVAISLWVTSDELSPEAITHRIGIEPSHVRVRGTPIRGRGMSKRPEFDHHEWQLRERLDIHLSDDVGGQTEGFITRFLERIKWAAARIKELSENNDVQVSVVYHVHEMPYVGLTRQHVHDIAALGANLDFDIMVG